MRLAFVNENAREAFENLAWCRAGLHNNLADGTDDGSLTPASISAGHAVPYKLGNWVGSDVESPPSAIQMLKPNVVVSRYYENTETGEALSLLLTHCKDARNLVGHYPPVCYPSSGYATDFNERVGLTVGDCEISLTEYAFVREYEDELEGTVVANFMVLPDGQISIASTSI